MHGNVWRPRSPWLDIQATVDLSHSLMKGSNIESGAVPDSRWDWKLSCKLVCKGQLSDKKNLLAVFFSKFHYEFLGVFVVSCTCFISPK